MKLWQSDQDLFELAKRELFTAVIGDIMDTLGLLNQFLPPIIRPLRDDMVVIGRAMTVLEADVFSNQVENSANPLSSKPFGLMLEALDDLKPGEVYRYTSGTVLETPVGTMEGEYEMLADDGEAFFAPIDRFSLSVPRVLH